MVSKWEEAFIGALVTYSQVTGWNDFSSPEMVKIYSKSKGWDGYTEAPEWIDNKTDVWSAGCILYVLLSDELSQPFETPNEIINDEPPALPDHIS